MILAKPEPRRREKAREDRVEAALVKSVRAQCVVRDDYCRFGGGAMPEAVYRLIGSCDGESEWAHLEGHRRFETVGRPPEERHATAWTVMMCRRHHAAYDAHKFSLEPLTSLGADEALRLTAGADSYEEKR